MKGRLNTTLMIISLAALCGCAGVAILAIDLYHRFYECAHATLDAGEREELLDQASELNDKADRLRREAADDINKARVKIEALQEFAKRNPDEDAEFDRRCTEIRTEIHAIQKKQDDVDALIEQAKDLINIVQSHE